MSEQARRVGTVCRESAGAWIAVCALLDHAESVGLTSSPWSTGGQPEAERVRTELDALLSAQPQAGLTPYDGQILDEIVRRTDTFLDEGELAFVVARLIDDCYWPSFTQEWLDERSGRFLLSGRERYPVGDMRLMGDTGHSSRPYRLSLPDGELPHVRRHSEESNIRVVVEGSYAAILDGLAGKVPLTVAAALVNETWGEMTAPPNLIAPGDPLEQMARTKRLIRHARERDVAVIVLPELCMTTDMVTQLAAEWAGQVDAPVLFAGSVHLSDAGQRVNRTSVLLPGVGVAWTHDKYSMFEARDGTLEPIDYQQPCVVLGCGHVVRVATVICKDLLDFKAATALGDLGVHLLAVPAMSQVLAPFSTAPEVLITRSQGATVVANNPRVWDKGPVEHALLGHPVSHIKRVVPRSSDGAPDLGIARLGSGWEQRMKSGIVRDRYT